MQDDRLAGSEKQAAGVLFGDPWMLPVPSGLGAVNFKNHVGTRKSTL